MGSTLKLAGVLLLLAVPAFAQARGPMTPAENPCPQGDELDKLACEIAHVNTSFIKIQPQIRFLVNELSAAKGANAWWAECLTRPECVGWVNNK